MRWIILRTGGGQTLPLMTSLRAAGFTVWTPARTIRKVLRPGKPSEKRIEVDVPILSSFLFGGEADMGALFAEARREGSPHATFSIFHVGDRVPLIGDGQVQGLRDEEARHAATMQAMREAESRDEAERIRIDAMKSRNAQRRARWALDKARIAELRARPCDLARGTEVRVTDMPALVGVTGVVEASEGPVAQVRFGALAWKIEAWRLAPAQL